MTTTKNTTNREDFAAFMAQANEETPAKAPAANGEHEADAPLKVDVTLNVQPVPRLQIVFPFGSATATVNLEIRENGQVHVEPRTCWTRATRSDPAAGRGGPRT